MDPYTGPDGLLAPVYRVLRTSEGSIYRVLRTSEGSIYRVLDLLMAVYRVLDLLMAVYRVLRTSEDRVLRVLRTSEDRVLRVLRVLGPSLTLYLGTPSQTDSSVSSARCSTGGYREVQGG